MYTKWLVVNEAIPTPHCGTVFDWLNKVLQFVMKCSLTLLSNYWLIKKISYSVWFQEDNSGFPWDETIQNQILGAFFWFHWVTQIPGGLLARKYGTKAIFGLSNFSCCILNLLIPLCAKTDYKLLVANRVLQGLIVVSILDISS